VTYASAGRAARGYCGTARSPWCDREQTDHYVHVGVGRDYADVPPTRGVYKGKANEELEVEVRIREL